MTNRVRYRKQWEREFPKDPPGIAAFREIAEDLLDATKVELRRTGLNRDPLARRYLDTLDTGVTDTGARVYTDDPFAHIVEWGSIYKEPDAPMRTAARRFGRFTAS